MTGGLERYEIRGVIGVGSFATVHRAHDRLLDDTVVLKILAENHSLNPEIRERFIAEGRSLRRVSSQHVITVHDIGESPQQQPYLVLEHADRGTLAERVRTLRTRGWTAAPKDVLAVVKPLAAALEAVHRSQLVHRDLSPGNLLLTSEATVAEHDESASPVVAPGERLMVADLGMCKDLAENSGLTVSGGTAGFRPPEQSGPGLVDTRADIWAASALIGWLSEGAQLPKSFHKVLRRGMQTDPRRRQQTVTQWGTELEEALAPPPVPEPAAAPENLAGADPQRPQPSSELHSDSGNGPGQTAVRPADASANSTSGAGHASGVRRRRRWRAVSVTGVIVAVLAGILTGYLMRGPDEPLAQADGATVAVEGPSEVQVGEPAVFTAETDGVESWVWVLPTGTHLADASEAVLTPTSTGAADIILRARAPDGTELEARHTLTVVE